MSTFIQQHYLLSFINLLRISLIYFFSNILFVHFVPTVFISSSPPCRLKVLSFTLLHRVIISELNARFVTLKIYAAPSSVIKIVYRGMGYVMLCY
jgi:hypothetical protein